jgi:CheY-like chemotaxis protein
MTGMNKWTILVVEDEPDGQMVISGLLNYFNVNVDAVGSAEEALHSLNDRQYNGAVIDLALPGMDGLQLIHQIRSNESITHLPCVAVTAYHTSGVKQQAINAGFDAYFAKPIDDTSFVRELSRLMEE